MYQPMYHRTVITKMGLGYFVQGLIYYVLEGIGRVVIPWNDLLRLLTISLVVRATAVSHYLWI